MAIAAGYPTADAYLDSIEPHEWAETLAFAAVEPWGPEAEARQRAEIVRLHAARLGQTITIDDILASWGFHHDDIDDGWSDMTAEENYDATTQTLQMAFGI